MGKPTVRNWREVTPYVDHESAIIWPIFRGKGYGDLPPEAAPMLDMVGFTIHRMQGGRSGDYHDHEDKEQVYYFTEGRGKMKTRRRGIRRARGRRSTHSAKGEAPTHKRLRRPGSRTCSSPPQCATRSQRLVRR